MVVYEGNTCRGASACGTGSDLQAATVIRRAEFGTGEETSVVDLPFENRDDFEDVDRGLIGAFDPGVVKDASGRVVQDNRRIRLPPGGTSPTRRGPG